MKPNKKITIVEDDPDLLFLLGKVLNNAGYLVECLPNGTSVVDNSTYEWPQLFILDKEMEFIDGITLCKYLKTNQRTESIPVLIISGGHELETKAFRAGANHFLQKPINMNDLLQTVYALLLRSKHVQQIN